MVRVALVHRPKPRINTSSTGLSLPWFINTIKKWKITRGGDFQIEFPPTRQLFRQPELRYSTNWIFHSTLGGHKFQTNWTLLCNMRKFGPGGPLTLSYYYTRIGLAEIFVIIKRAVHKSSILTLDETAKKFTILVAYRIFGPSLIFLLPLSIKSKILCEAYK